MLNHTFCHLSGIGQKTEERLWQAGISSWDLWVDPPPVKLRNSSRLEIPLELDSSLDALTNNPGYFTSRLTSKEQWRIFPHFREKTAYIDIETTGLHDDAEITTIALYDGKGIFTYINGKNLNQFIDDIGQYEVLVSYNGKSFDIPFIERYFGITLGQAQIDLRYVLAGLGFKGGLKGCEKQLNIRRDDTLDGVDGYWAVLLWKEYVTYNDEKALETLLAYNIEDVVNLEELLIIAYNIHVERTPFQQALTIPKPLKPDVPYQPDYKTVSRIKEKYFSGRKQYW